MLTRFPTFLFSFLDHVVNDAWYFYIQDEKFHINIPMLFFFHYLFLQFHMSKTEYINIVTHRFSGLKLQGEQASDSNV